MSSKKSWMKKSAFAKETITTTTPTPPEDSNYKDETKKDAIVQPKPNSMTDLFAPTQIEEICVATKKINDLRDWLKTEKKQSQICLLTGPTGSGKTTAVNLLAKELKYEIKEWINPVDCELITHLGDQYNNEVYTSSQLALFKSFLFKASRYKSLFDTHNKRLLLVEDFPNVLITDPAAFTMLLEEYVNYGRSPLLFIISDSKSRNLNMQYKLFPDQVKDRLKIAHLEFNAISMTLLQKAMKRFCQILSQLPATSYKVPAKDILDSIIISSQGDIRNAVINLHFTAIVCERSNLETIPVPTQGKTKMKKVQQRTLKSIGCDKSVTLLHALGRVFNPKLDETGQFIHKPEEISDDFTTEPRKFHNLVFANYARHFSNIGDVINASDGLSLTDVMLTEYRENELTLSGLDVCIRSVMVANKKPVSGWMPLCKTVHTNDRNKTERFDGIGDSNWMSRGLFQTDYNTFVKIISKKHNSK